MLSISVNKGTHLTNDYIIVSFENRDLLMILCNCSFILLKVIPLLI